jgi:hypothetical protein
MRTEQPSGEVVAAIVAAVTAALTTAEGRQPTDLRLLAAVPVTPGPSPWALAGRLQQMRGMRR